MMKLVTAAFVLLAVPALADPAAAPADATAKSYAKDPSGEGDANAITCRPPQTLPGSRLRGPEACRTNAQWAQYRKDGMDVAADGIHDVPSEKLRTVTPAACHPATMGGSNASMNQVNISLVCD